MSFITKSILFIITIFIFAGCSATKIPLKESNYDNVLIENKACSLLSLRDAKKKAIIGLSNQLISNVNSKDSSTQKSSYNSDNKRENLKTNSIASFNIASEFLSITPKYIENYKQTQIFKDDLYCSTAIIDNALNQKYLKLAKADFKIVLDALAYQNAEFDDKNRVIEKVLNENFKYISEYNKLYDVLRVLPAKFNLVASINVASMSKFLNAKPSIDIDVAKNLYYKTTVTINSKIRDENEDYKVEWFLDNKKISSSKSFKKYFKKPAVFRLKLKVTDDKGLTKVKNYKLVLKNRKPNASFRTNKEYYRDNEIVKVYSSASDPEGDLKYVYYRYKRKGSSKSYKFTSNMKFKRLGTYTITQVVVDKYGKKDYATKTIVIDNKKPKAGFYLQKTVFNKYEPISIKSTAADYEHRIKSITYYIYNLNSSMNYWHQIKSNDKINVAGRYKIEQVVVDDYGNTSKANIEISVENKHRKELKANMSQKYIQSYFGKPNRKERVGIFAISDWALDYGDYWLIFDDYKLKCVVYASSYIENYDCRDYRRHNVKVSLFQQ